MEKIDPEWNGQEINVNFVAVFNEIIRISDIDYIENCHSYRDTIDSYRTLKCEDKEIVEITRVPVFLIKVHFIKEVEEKRRGNLTYEYYEKNLAEKEFKRLKKILTEYRKH